MAGGRDTRAGAFTVVISSVVQSAEDRDIHRLEPTGRALPRAGKGIVSAVCSERLRLA